MTAASIARQIDINGIVQGVGFRPYVFQLAEQHRLAGQVANTATGVTLVVEGPARQVQAFIDALPQQRPPLAHIVEMTCKDCPATGRSGFQITPSRSGDRRATLISPDVAVCEDCRGEMFDPADRRFGYPFINCTNCGPRYTIIEDVPYDRPKTAMRAFTMCPDCQAEYDDPRNRRFHAQPNACSRCGPRVALFDARHQPVADAAGAIDKVADLLRAGKVVAIKGLGGFHLAADAVNDRAVARLRRRKHREEKPLAVMAPDLATIETFAVIGPAERRLLTSIQRPIVLLSKKLPERLAFEVSPRNSYYGVMLPYTPLHYLIMAQGFDALVMTSGNLSEEPIAIDNQDAFERLADIADFFLVHDRDIYLRSDDSIVRHCAGDTRFIRRSRGYVPVPVFVKDELPPILACGAELKNTICLTKGKQAFLSQHIGDLENLATDAFFKLTVDHLKRILDIAPVAIACDLHPDYLNTRWANAQSDLQVIHIQHHFAHIAACMAENRAKGPVIGLAFDGTGFGKDGTIWGGEVLKVDYSGYRRLAHLDPVPMPGSAAAIKAPWRMALAYLHKAYGHDLWQLPLPLFRTIKKEDGYIIEEMIDRRINAPLTSSLGRLFDAVAAIVGLRSKVVFEGQAAMELEMIADHQPAGPYPFAWSDGPIRRIDPVPIVRAIVDDIAGGLPAFIISRRFHDTLIQMFTDLCVDLRHEQALNRVALSGGVFQNALLLTGMIQALEHRGFEVLTHRQVPANDGGIALGQAVVAAAVLASGGDALIDTA